MADPVHKPHVAEEEMWIETIVAAFTDHLAIVMRMETSYTVLTCGRGFWRMNLTLLSETDFRQLLQNKW
jgi:hypothetical protein